MKRVIYISQITTYISTGSVNNSLPNVTKEMRVTEVIVDGIWPKTSLYFEKNNETIVTREKIISDLGVLFGMEIAKSDSNLNDFEITSPSFKANLFINSKTEVKTEEFHQLSDTELSNFILAIHTGYWNYFEDKK